MPFIPPPNTSPAALKWLDENWDRLTREQQLRIREETALRELMRGNEPYYENNRTP